MVTLVRSHGDGHSSVLSSVAGVHGHCAMLRCGNIHGIGGRARRTAHAARSRTCGALRGKCECVGLLIESLIHIVAGFQRIFCNSISTIASIQSNGNNFVYSCFSRLSQQSDCGCPIDSNAIHGSLQSGILLTVNFSNQFNSGKGKGAQTVCRCEGSSIHKIRISSTSNNISRMVMISIFGMQNSDVS